MTKQEILFCNLTLKNGKNNLFLEKVVYKYTDGFYKNLRLGIKEPLEVLKVDVICSLGFENNASGYTELKKSEEKRNNITGAYD